MNTEKVIKDNEFQLNWTNLATDLNEDDSFDLSKSIVRLWVTIGGF